MCDTITMRVVKEPRPRFPASDHPVASFLGPPKVYFPRLVDPQRAICMPFRKKTTTNYHANLLTHFISPESATVHADCPQHAGLVFPFHSEDLSLVYWLIRMVNPYQIKHNRASRVSESNEGACCGPHLPHQAREDSS